MTVYEVVILNKKELEIFHRDVYKRQHLVMRTEQDMGSSVPILIKKYFQMGSAGYWRQTLHVQRTEQESYLTRPGR